MDALSKIAALVKDPNVTVDTTTFVVALIVSLLVAFYIAALYRLFYENRATGSQIHRSFMLLGPAITALFIAIQFSLPLSLGLLGALSIIRFRTPVKEPEEVGFIMLLVACSVVVATFQLLLLVALLIVTTVGLTIKRYSPSIVKSSRQDGIVLVSISDMADVDAITDIQRLLVASLPKGKLESISEVAGMSNLQVSFCDLTVDGLANMRQQLKAKSEIKSVNVYFNKSSSLV
jgi:hypothetical protein